MHESKPADGPNQPESDSTDESNQDIIKSFDQTEQQGADSASELERPDRFRHLFHSSQDAIAEVKITDEGVILQAVNEAFEGRFEGESAELCGQSVDGSIIPQDSVDGQERVTEKITADATSKGIITRTTVSGDRQFHYRSVPYEQNGTQYAFITYTDITEQKQREKELKAKKEQAEEFASILTHDLRNPVHIAQGYITQLDDAANSDSIARIERALDRIDEMIDQTLTLTREAGSIDGTRAVSVSDVARSSWELVETGDSELHITDDFEFVCDPDRVSRLFENVFRNAVDHNDDPVTVRIGVHDTLTVSTRGNTELAFYIQDDGCGIPKEKRNEVLEFGNTTSREGTGLGLPIVDRVATAHGWRMEIGETVTGGAKFIFSNVDIT